MLCNHPLCSFQNILIAQKETPYLLSSCSPLPARRPTLWTCVTHGDVMTCPPSSPPHATDEALCSGDQSGRLTCSHKEDAGAEDDVVLAAVESPGAKAEPAEQQEGGAEDGEGAGGAHEAWPAGDTERAVGLAILPARPWASAPRLSRPFR